MNIHFNSYRLPNVIALNTQRITRNTETQYNADGDMLIDMVSRKYVLTIYLGPLPQPELRSLLGITENIFFKVSFDSPAHGPVTADFHIREQMSETDFTWQGITYYKAMKLVLEER